MLSVNLAGVTLKNPVMTASGTFGFGREYNEFYNLSELGAVNVKGLTLNPRLGNVPPRIAETPLGILNSVGLQNPGVDKFIEEEIPFLRQFDTKIIANISGSTVEDYLAIAEKMDSADVDLLELNISCPNVKAGGMTFGTCPTTVESLVKQVREKTSKPLIVKLSPNVTDVTEIARAAEAGGADVLSLINTLLGMRIDIRTRRPILHNNMGGMSGPAVFPVAVRMVYQVHRATKLPIIGMGGISTGRDAVEMMLAGASAVAVGTACFRDPFAPIKVRDGIEAFCKEQGVSNVSEIVGTVRPW
ncbi:MAG: dihydroorotate dehydrogenase [Ruminococcaceae bacterium]|nr:dihydroorotate dehydrogenase [Oscillospiraceae bacterium]